MKIESILEKAMKNEITKEAADIVVCHIDMFDRNYRDKTKVETYVTLHWLFSDVNIPFDETYDRLDIYEAMLDETLFQVLGEKGLYKAPKSELYRVLIERVLGEPAENLLDERRLFNQEKIRMLFNDYQIAIETRRIAVKLGDRLKKNLQIFVNGEKR